MARPSDHGRKHGKRGGVPPVATRWKKGQSGNPGGRPKGFGALIRAETGDGLELVQRVLKILRAKDSSDHDAMEAAKFLADRGWGKAQQFIEHSGSVSEIVIEEQLGDGA